MELIPLPKTYEEKGGRFRISPVISCGSEELLPAVKVFSDYAEKAFGRAWSLGGAENGYYVVRMPTLVNGVPAKVGGTPHPSAADNEISSDALAAYLRTIL